MVEDTAHNGSVAGSIPVGPNCHIAVCYFSSIMFVAHYAILYWGE